MKNNNDKILIEIGTEELPYKNLYNISKNLKDVIKNNIQKININYSLIKNFITSRRISFIITLCKTENNVILEKKIKELIDKSLTDVNFKIKMRWKNYTKSFIRPVKWYVLLLNEKIINHTIFNIKSKNKTLSHKTLKKEIKINAHNYEYNLEKYGHVICNYKKRKDLIINSIKNHAKKHDLDIILKRESISNITNLIEYPSLIICSFKKEFLKLPKEIITTVLLKNNFCFLLKKKDKIINKIIIIVDALRKTKEIKTGYEYIINTKLSELKYLYENEKKYIKTTKISDLKKLVLNDKLGNMYEKTIRIKNIITYINNTLDKKSNKTLIKAAKLIKIDMLTKIVTEIPELNGLICSYNLENIKIKKHLYNYNRIINNKIKKNKHSSLLVLSDLIDNITSFFVIGKIPTSSKDPFNLKKDAKLIIKIIIKNKININIKDIIEYTLKLHKVNNNILNSNISNFIKQKITNKKEYDLIIKSTDNILMANNKITLMKTLNKYQFNEKLTSFLKRIYKITEKNKILSYIKINKNLFIKIEEKILFTKIKKQLKTLNFLNKKNLFFECAKTFTLLENEITKYFNNVLVLDKETKTKNNRLKLLNIIKNISLKKVNLNFFV